MMDLEQQVTALAQEVAVLREEQAQARSRRARLIGRLLLGGSGALIAGAVGAILFVSRTAHSDPAMATACNAARTTQAYCFAGGTPALASQVNSNFEFAYSGIDTANAGIASLTASKFDKGAQYSPNYTAWGAVPQGAGGAAIANDNGTYKKLMVVGNTSAGGAREVGVWDNLAVANNLTAGGRITVGVYQLRFLNTQDISCNGGDVLVGGGAQCAGVGTLLDSYPSSTGSWHADCWGGSSTTTPTAIYAACLSHGN